MVMELAGDVVADSLPRKFCPLLNGPCVMSDCAWFLSDRICAIARIAVRLDVLVEGVPVVRLFRDGDVEEAGG